jgi:hypothetical protein
MVAAFEWSSWYGLLLAAAGSIITIGGAFLLLVRGVRYAQSWLRPSPPLVAFGHPSEDVMPWVMLLGGSDSEYEAQIKSHESVRLAHLSISYLIENKDTHAFRELATGMEVRDGAKTHEVDDCFVQVLAPGEKVDVTNVSLPRTMFEGMADSDRARNFIYWATFTDAQGRRWKATYDPVARLQGFSLLSR